MAGNSGRAHFLPRASPVGRLLDSLIFRGRQHPGNLLLDLPTGDVEPPPSLGPGTTLPGRTRATPYFSGMTPPAHFVVARPGCHGVRQARIHAPARAVAS